MKKILISVLLSLAILASLTVSAFALDADRAEDKTIDIVMTEESNSTVVQTVTTEETPLVTEEGATETQENTDVVTIPSTGKKGKLAPAIILLLVTAAFVVTLILKRTKKSNKTKVR